MKAATVPRWQELIAIDEEYDRNRASNGFSRFGVYLTMRLPAVAGEDPDILTDPIRWAAFAWAAATPPVMSPGYVAWNGPIEDIELSWDDGQLVAEIVIRTELSARVVGWRSWERDRCGDLIEPWHADRVALSRVSLRTVLDLSLPEAPGTRATSREYVDAGKSTVSFAGMAVERALRSALPALTETCSCRHRQGVRP